MINATENKVNTSVNKSKVNYVKIVLVKQVSCQTWNSIFYEYDQIKTLCFNKFTVNPKTNKNFKNEFCITFSHIAMETIYEINQKTYLYF